MTERLLEDRRAPPPRRAEERHPVVRVVFLLLGMIFVLLGFIGLFLPVMPTVPFLIVAAACFTRSSSRLEAWMLDHPRFGPLLRDWRERGAIPRRAKWLALVGSCSGFVVMLVLHAPGWPLGVCIAAVIAAAMVYVFSRPDA